jgi:hypothetical protein
MKQRRWTTWHSIFSKGSHNVIITDRIPEIRHKSNSSTNFMDQRPSWEADTCSAGQWVPSILWKPKVRYCVHKSPPLEPIPRQMNRFHTLIELISILILSSHLGPDFPNGLFPSDFPTSILNLVTPHTFHMPRPFRPPLSNYPDNIWW